MTLVLLSLCIGGSVIIDYTFNNSLATAKENATSRYNSIQNTIAIAANVDGDISYNDLNSILSKVTASSDSSVVNVVLTNKTTNQTIYVMDSDATRLDVSLGGADNQMNIWKENDCYYIQISSVILVNSGISSFGYDRQLDVVFDISNTYSTKNAALATLHKALCVTFVVGIIFILLLARFLTSPLAKLGTATKEIANGNLAARANVHSGDEFEALATDFNTMAVSLEENINELQLTLKKQEEFMGDFAHELKTPMTAIIGYADLLRSTEMTAEEQNEAANYIFTEGKRLESLSFKLLDLLVLRNDKVTLTPANPAAVVNAAVNLAKKAYAQKNVSIFAELEPSRANLDADLFQSLITNVLDNARKAMDGKGEIRVKGKNMKKGYVIAISDNGRGMDESELSRITEAFYRVDKSRSRAQGGAGLGLAICNEIAKLHGATISFESELGVGTTVTITLPKCKEVADYE